MSESMKTRTILYLLGLYYIIAAGIVTVFLSGVGMLFLIAFTTPNAVQPSSASNIAAWANVNQLFSQNQVLSGIMRFPLPVVYMLMPLSLFLYAYVRACGIEFSDVIHAYRWLRTGRPKLEPTS